MIEELLICRHGKQVFLEDALGLENIPRAVKKTVLLPPSETQLGKKTPQKILTGLIIVRNKNKVTQH